MKGYSKRFFIGHIFILFIVSLCLYAGLSLAAFIIGILLFETLIYFLDVKYIPRRKAELANKLIAVFKAEPNPKGVVKFKLNTFDFFVNIAVDYKVGLSQIANVETISFHIPRYQVDRLLAKPRFEWKKDEMNGVQTYNVHQTDGSGLKLAKEKLEKML